MYLVTLTSRTGLAEWIVVTAALPASFFAQNLLRFVKEIHTRSTLSHLMCGQNQYLSAPHVIRIVWKCLDFDQLHQYIEWKVQTIFFRQDRYAWWRKPMQKISHNIAHWTTTAMKRNVSNFDAGGGKCDEIILQKRYMKIWFHGKKKKRKEKRLCRTSHWNKASNSVSVCTCACGFG